MANQKNVDEFFEAIKADPNVPAEIRRRAEEVRIQIPQEVLKSDVWIYRAVVAVLGITVLATITGGLGLAFKGDLANYKLPAEIVAIGSAAVGALAGLLAPSPREKT
jgi:hypothetical protein